ncbi:hypothetical protein DOY81_012993 [Sarcophaga bullata]|nr:hypothetical protein DOY81_012993 [Sarcophaga bullata]
MDLWSTKPTQKIVPKQTACTQRSGIYKILVTQHSNESFYVECDSETEGGSWTVIQRRQDGSIDFYREWKDYEEGFGDVDAEHFIGLKKLYALTNFQGPQELLIVMGDVNNTRAFAKYNGFSIGNETEMYKLKKLGIFSGTAGDSFTYHLDRDNDSDSRNCAVSFRGHGGITDVSIVVAYANSGEYSECKNNSKAIQIKAFKRQSCLLKAKY